MSAERLRLFEIEKEAMHGIFLLSFLTDGEEMQALHASIIHLKLQDEEKHKKMKQWTTDEIGVDEQGFLEENVPIVQLPSHHRWLSRRNSFHRAQPRPLRSSCGTISSLFLPDDVFL